MATFRLLIWSFLLFLSSNSIDCHSSKRFFLWGGGPISPEAYNRFANLAGGKILVISSASSSSTKTVFNFNDVSAVWIAGGDQYLLMKREMGLRPILKRLSSRGILIGGTSAGASSVSRIMVYKDTWHDGFGLTDLIIDQHFDERKRLPRLQSLVKTHPSFIGIGIDRCTGCIIIGDRLEVIGKGFVTICRKQNVSRIKSGGVVILR